MTPLREPCAALDLFCGAGGVCAGLQRAGFDVTGIDNRPQPRYPGRFILGDALRPPVRLEDFDFVWASPPCQGYSIMRNLPWLKGRTWPMLIEPVRAMLEASAAQWCIENVVGAPLKGAMLCGRMFWLKVYRHRLFETSFFLMTPTHPKYICVIGQGRFLNGRERVGRNGMVSLAGKVLLRERSLVMKAMGIDHEMTKDELAQAIPPAYAEFIGRQARLAVEASAR